MVPRAVDTAFAISIHAPAKGATILGLNYLLVLKISIHAPAKGATEISIFLFVPPSISIHAPAKGATSHLAFVLSIKKFQSTLPQRERRTDIFINIAYMNFNPRSRKGSDGGGVFISE